MNPIETIKSFMSKGTNPQQMIMNMMGNQNPMINNLVNMAKEGNTKGIEDFARNLFKEKGRDFDSEYKDFMNKLGS